MPRKFQRRKVIDCFFCESKKEPDYKEAETLSRFISDRGKIIPTTRSGVCAQHQRRLDKAIKRARFLSLLPFLARV